jgi:ribonuclease D
VPDPDLPAHEKGRSLRIRPGVPELLNAVLRARAGERHVAPTLIATMRDLEILAHDPRREEARALSLLNGWRREMVGNELVDILEGRATVRVDGRGGRLRVERQRQNPPQPDPAPGGDERKKDA